MKISTTPNALNTPKDRALVSPGVQIYMHYFYRMEVSTQAQKYDANAVTYQLSLLLLHLKIKLQDKWYRVFFYQHFVTGDRIAT